MARRKKNQSLIRGCTSKGNKGRHGGKVASSFVVVSRGKGICYCEHYEKLSDKFPAEFIENNCLEIFKSSCYPTWNVFVQDNDLSQNSKATKTDLDNIGAVQFSIPPHSPDLNPIENASNLVNKKSSSDAVKYSVSKKSYAKFVKRAENTLLSYSIELIGNN